MSGLSANGNYANGSTYVTSLWYTCNYTALTGSGKTITVNMNSSTSSFIYAAAVDLTGNTQTSTGCNDGYNHAQSTSANTAVLSGTIATTNAHDLVVEFQGNNTGGTTTAGTDGQGHSMTLRSDSAGVADMSTVSESATNTYSAAFTISSSPDMERPRSSY